MKCFFHRADLDGQCSGAIVYSYYGDICEMVGINYGDSFPWDSIKKGETVFMVDFSLPRNDMDKLNSISELIWIDHHDTAIKEMDGLKIQGIQKNGLGACAWVWEYLYKDKLPEGIKLLASYDVWDHTNPKTLPFQYAMGLEYTFPDSSIWTDVFQSNSFWMLKMINIGKTVKKKVEKDNRSYINAFGFATMFEGYSVIAVNRGMINSMVFDSVEGDYDLMMTFVFHRDKHWNFSIYTNKDHIHCGELAKKYGGGGHRQAAGFISNTIPKGFLN